jgi:hypothetical protein
VVYSQDYELTEQGASHENLLMEFLTQVNHEAVKAGVLPNPLTGKVGNMDATTMIEANNAIRRTNGRFTVRAIAKGDITSAGPVRIKLEVVQKNDAQ